jgi:diphosphomevalonate decarboxylase
MAIEDRDFNTLARIVELDSNLLHAVAMTSQPIINYWLPVTLQIMQAITNWRKNGIPCCFTVDAGPNVHVICDASANEQVAAKLQSISSVQNVIVCHPGGGTHLE